MKALLLFDLAFLVEDIEDFDFEGFEVLGVWFSGRCPGLDEAVADSRRDCGGEGGRDWAKVLLADEMDRRHDWRGDLESRDDSSDWFEVDGIEAEGLGGDIAEGNGVAEELAVAQADEDGVTNQDFFGREVGVDRVGSTGSRIERNVYDPEGTHMYSLQFAAGSLQIERGIFLDVERVTVTRWSVLLLYQCSDFESMRLIRLIKIGS